MAFHFHCSPKLSCYLMFECFNNLAMNSMQAWELGITIVHKESRYCLSLGFHIFKENSPPCVFPFYLCHILPFSSFILSPTVPSFLFPFFPFSSFSISFFFLLYLFLFLYLSFSFLLFGPNGNHLFVLINVFQFAE